MKQIASFGLLIFSVIFLISCKKNSVYVNDMNATILGKWFILTDSTFIGVGSMNHAVNYTGQNSDYFDFRTDSNVYTREGPVLDTLSYSLTSDSTILITSFGLVANGVPETCYITNLTAHNVTIHAPISITPGGIFGRKVNLNR